MPRVYLSVPSNGDRGFLQGLLSSHTAASRWRLHAGALSGGPESRDAEQLCSRTEARVRETGFSQGAGLQWMEQKEQEIRWKAQLACVFDNERD